MGIVGNNMDNAYDLIEKKNLLFVLPEDRCKGIGVLCDLKKVAIIVYLYYEDTLDQFFKYIDNIPEGISTYIISSNQATYNKIQRYIVSKKDCFSIYKDNNRGRDISALLISAKKIIEEYDIICFIHDKKVHMDEEQYKGISRDTQLWIKNLWDNTLKSKEYIYNILELFQNSNIGMLVPPEPIGECRTEWYTCAWGSNFENVKVLAEELKLSCDISREKPPITLGTVFWSRTDAIRKLFSKSWVYDDFPQEPLPVDGTISHAVERILAYVAQDAGYDTGIAMCTSYAETLLLGTRKILTETNIFLQKELGIAKLSKIGAYEEKRINVERIFEKCEEIYLYGAGNYGRNFLRKLIMWGYKPKGFIVSEGKRIEKYVEGYSVYEINELENRDKIGVIITADPAWENEMVNNLVSYGYLTYIKC